MNSIIIISYLLLICVICVLHVLRLNHIDSAINKLYEFSIADKLDLEMIQKQYAKICKMKLSKYQSLAVENIMLTIKNRNK